MTDSAKAVMWGFGKGFAVLLSAAAIFQLGGSVGAKRRDIDANSDNIRTLQQSLASEINTRTSNDAQSASDMRVVIIRLDDILRRLDRAGIR